MSTTLPAGIAPATARGAPFATSSATAPALEAVALVRRHRGGRGVGPVDLTVPAGETLALMGPNGAGKSTLLRVLATIDRPGSGAVRWGGDASRARARRGIGLALDRAVEEATLSGHQAAHFWCRQWVGDGAEARRLVEAALRRFGLWAVRDEPVGAYSFGMLRRLALVEALAHDPALALLDEPTAGLDPEGVAVLREELSRRERAGRATVVASNDPEFVERAAGRVLLLHEGRPVRCAAPGTLLAELDAARVAELTLVDAGEEAVVALALVPGVEAVERIGGGVAVRFRGDLTLPALVAAADRPAGALRGVRLREPDLRDCFRALTGADLPSEGAP